MKWALGSSSLWVILFNEALNLDYSLKLFVEIVTLIFNYVTAF